MKKLKLFLFCMMATFTMLALTSCSDEEAGEKEENNPAFFEPERTVNLERPGTLPLEITAKDMYNIRSLKVTGPIDGTDIRLLRKMAGNDEKNEVTPGILAELDLRDARIVPGGLDFVGYLDERRTEYDVIGGNMFMNCCVLEKIVLPKSTIKIDVGAFSSCSNLQYVFLPEKLEEIGHMAFSNCKSLISINLPEGISYLSGVFVGCKNLTYIELPKSLVSLSGTFAGCTNLKSVDLSNVRYIDSAFQGCGFETINFPSNIENYFVLRDGTFENCRKLKSITFPNDFFKKCTSRSQDNSSWNPFISCINLKSIYMESNEPPYFSDSLFPILLKNIYSDLRHSIDVYIPRGSYEAYNKIKEIDDDFQQNDIVNFIEYDF